MNYNNSYQGGNAMLAPFLRDLAEKVETNQLSNEQLQQVGEFLMSYTFWNQVEKDNKEYGRRRRRRRSRNKTNMTDNDFKKFMIMGWWIYTQIADLTE